jgi:prevent-host-death family protein
MIQMQAAEAKTHFLKLLTQVENGETISITRHGKAIARLTPEDKPRKTNQQLLAELQEIRKGAKTISIDQLLEDIQSDRRF